MNSEKRIRAILILKENGNTVKTIKFHLGIETVRYATCSTTFRQNFGKNSYTLTLIAEEESSPLEEESKQSSPWVLISSPVEIDISNQNLLTFLSSFISEDKMIKQIQEQAESFIMGIRLNPKLSYQ